MISPLAAAVLATPWREPPLDPSGDEARRLLRRELSDPEYYDRNILERILTWIGRTLDGVVGAAGDVGPLVYFAAVVAVVGLAAGVIVLATRVRRTARSRTVGTGPALAADSLDAAALRARASTALNAGDASTALVDGFRALALGQVERGAIADRPQATAHELALAIAAATTTDPALADPVADAAGLFDLVLYGDHLATPDQARRMLELEARMAGQRVGR